MIKVVFYISFVSVIYCCASSISAEEFFAMGTAYYELGKFAEAEKWFAKASAIKKTMNASEYNLGRIAFETKRYEEALRHFEKLVKADPQNVMALKAAAYTEIMRENYTKADEYYKRVLELEPESADEGYNRALVLYKMKKYNEAEEILNKYSYSMPENKNNVLLLARLQSAQKKVEALETYATWLSVSQDPQVRYEYIMLLYGNTYYARAIEEAKKLVAEVSADTATLKRADIQFLLARLLLTADPENPDGMTELQNAVNSGFNDLNALDALVKDPNVKKSNLTEIQNIIANVIAQQKKD
ncbi:MAG: tetratricopeptide repeat protein [Spirochaetaceae bacterium]|jgi:tetratricopeptide (TPR) repeat protein|nr:tetratricopeptide repeat protein [Spirochaetaceae bacterium]GMO18235.1 MAG: hypothetical protein Pg6A_04970 [Termitinemataceae bacterium]